MSGKRFVHTLSYPEHLWLDFFQSFFAQETLVVDEDGLPITNAFKFDIGQIPENRKFDILLEESLHANNPNILPCVVIEDLGCQSLNIALNRLVDWSVSPETGKERSDLIRTTYVIHCASRKRGESRLLAAIVSNAITVFYDQLLQAGLHKIEPWSIGKTVPIKSDSDSTYLDTPVQITFEYQQTWKTIEDGPSDNWRYCLKIRDDERVRYIRAVIDISDPEVSRYVSMAMNLQDPNANIYVNTAMDLMEPLIVERHILTSQELVDPDAENEYVRASMRVA